MKCSRGRICLVYTSAAYNFMMTEVRWAKQLSRIPKRHTRRVSLSLSLSLFVYDLLKWSGKRLKAVSFAFEGHGGEMRRTQDYCLSSLLRKNSSSRPVQGRVGTLFNKDGEWGSNALLVYVEFLSALKQWIELDLPSQLLRVVGLIVQSRGGMPISESTYYGRSKQQMFS